LFGVHLLPKLYVKAPAAPIGARLSPFYLVLRSRYFFWGLAGAMLASGCARTNFFQADARLTAVEVAARHLPPAGPDSVWATAGRHYAQHGRLHGWLVGRHHRAAWAAPVRVPVLALRTARPEAGPLTPTKLGGGFQSTSLSLRGADGRPYVLRTIDKDPARILPKFFQKTFVANVLRDETSAGTPYGALVLPVLAQALGIAHAQPRVFYVLAGADFGLPEANARLSGKLVLLEEKLSGPHARSPLLPTARAYLDEAALAERLAASPRARLDQPALLRARLLDVLVGDWDRHAGQWQWAELPDSLHPLDRQRLVAVPKDRDQVFFRFADGLLPWLLTRRGPARHLTTFGAAIRDLPALVSNGRRVDERGLNELRRRDFRAAAALVQACLPDSVLARAVRRLPPAAFAAEGNGLLAALRRRRDQLPAVAEAYFTLLARRPVVRSTREAERFVVDRMPDSTTVRVYSRALGPDSLCFARTFYRRETRRLLLADLDAADVRDVRGRGGLRVRWASRQPASLDAGRDKKPRPGRAAPGPAAADRAGPEAASGAE